MILKNIVLGTFIDRKNRFVGEGLLNDKIINFHIGDTGRLKEILFKNNKILLQKINQRKLKYNFRLIAGKGLLNNFVLLNSLLHSALVKEYLDKLNYKYKSEIKIGNSKIDFLINNTFVEIKGCSLIKRINESFIGLFPDAPTKRGQKHLNELITLIKQKKQAEIWFLLTNNVNYFKPNLETDPVFSKLFYKFIELGGKVQFLYVKLNYYNDIIELNLKKQNVNIL